jgi:uncharacterized repeat protein (TIGR03803 family)
VGSLTEGRDGALYGTTIAGGTNGAGTVFKLNKDGSAYLRVWDFGPNLGGRYPPAGPSAGVVEGSDGALYLTTIAGGDQNAGTILKLDANGGGYRILYSFKEGLWGGAEPGVVLEGGDGVLYGITQFGGAADPGEPSDLGGIVFKVNKDGSGFRTLHTFTSQPSDGAQPTSLIAASDGALYGTTLLGGAQDSGTVFKVGRDGTGYGVLFSFGVSGLFKNNPNGLSEGPDGLLYGSASTALFRMNKDGTGYTVLREFPESAPPPTPGTDRVLYGVTSRGGTTTYGTIYRLDLDGSGFELLHDFNPSGGDASSPSSPLVASGTDGLLYGVTPMGGHENVGAVFRLNKDGGAYGLLRSFSRGGDAGSNPAGLLEASDSLLYGTTSAGGSSNLGTIFRLSRDGQNLDILHNFTGADGSNPAAGLMEGSDGALYGTTPLGGHTNLGTVFRLGKDGRDFTVLRTFAGGTNDASNPHAGVIEASDGVLYGTTDASVFLGCTVFRLQKDGGGFAVLHHYDGISDANTSRGELLEGSDGVLYGTTVWGGAGQSGTVFRLNKDGSGYSILVHFGGSRGADPYSRLLEGPDGALYGTTFANYPGVVSGLFKVNKDGSGFVVLHSFDPGAGGGYSPQTGLSAGGDGAFYGVASAGGDINLGTVFRLSSSPFPARLTSLRFDTPGVYLRVAGDAGLTYEVQTTPALPSSSWQPLGLLTVNSESLGQFLDRRPPGETSRFYRAATSRQ